MHRVIHTLSTADVVAVETLTTTCCVAQRVPRIARSLTGETCVTRLELSTDAHRCSVAVDKRRPTRADPALLQPVSPPPVSRDPRSRSDILCGGKELTPKSRISAWVRGCVGAWVRGCVGLVGARARVLRDGILILWVAQRNVVAGLANVVRDDAPRLQVPENPAT